MKKKFNYIDRIKGERNISLDIIRIIALFLVLFTHTGRIGSKIYTDLEPRGIYYIFCLTLDTTRMLAVPLFLMISGILLLDKKESFKVIWKKRITRILIVILVFSLIQEFFYGSVDLSKAFFHEFLINVCAGSIRGSYWYLYLYLAYLLLLPILRNIADRMDEKFFLYIIFLSTIADLLAIIPNWTGKYISLYEYIAIINGYAFLFPLLGYSSYQYLSKKKLKFIQYMVLILIFLSINLFLSYLMHNEHKATGIWTEGYIWRLTALLTVPVFMVTYDITRRFVIPQRVKCVIAIISESCFGIYLSENILEKYTIKIYEWCYELTGCTLWSCFIYLLTTMIIGTLFFHIIKKYLPGVVSIL